MISTLITIGIASLPQFCLVITCLYYLLKMKSLDGAILFLSSLMILGVINIKLALIPQLLQNEIIDTEGWMLLLHISNTCAYLMNMVFVFGLLMLVNKVLKK